MEIPFLKTLDARVTSLRKRAAKLALRLYGVLEPPSPPNPEGEQHRADSRAALAWLRAHAHEHEGKWVALLSGALLDSDPSRLVLHRRLKARGQLTERVMMVRL